MNENTRTRTPLILLCWRTTFIEEASANIVPIVASRAEKSVPRTLGTAMATRRRERSTVNGILMLNFWLGQDAV
jgi:hypothetical protein